jgi:hypothetical protein
MISIDTYWKDPATGEDRRVRFARDFSAEIDRNAHDLVPRIVRFLEMYRAATGDRATEFTWASGWRPPSINAATKNAAAVSKHMLGNAGDVREPESRPLTTWAMTLAGEQARIACDLYMEHPSCTRGETGRTPWCHLQRVPPRSKRRVYYPR